MKPIATRRLVIRNWREDDRDLFFLINSDERVMEYFPIRRSRAEADAMMDRLRERIEDRGYGFTALERTQDGACIGFAGLDREDGLPCRPDGAIEVGWRLAPEFWGAGYATEAAKALLGFGFETLGLDEIVSFAVRENVRSTAVMGRIGMVHLPDCDFDHARVPDTHPQLRPHVLYSITAAQWRDRPA